MADLAELEARLKAAAQRCERAQDPDDFLPAYRSRLTAERALALAKNEETATELLWTPLWDPGAPEPHLLCSGWKTFLVYYIVATVRPLGGRVSGPIPARGAGACGG